MQINYENNSKIFLFKNIEEKLENIEEEEKSSNSYSKNFKIGLTLFILILVLKRIIKRKFFNKVKNE